MELYFVKDTHYRRELARDYWEAKRAIRQAHKRGDYTIAAVLRRFLNGTFSSWQLQRSL